MPEVTTETLVAVSNSLPYVYDADPVQVALLVCAHILIELMYVPSPKFLPVMMAFYPDGFLTGPILGSIAVTMGAS